MDFIGISQYADVVFLLGRQATVGGNESCRKLHRVTTDTCKYSFHISQNPDGHLVYVTMPNANMEVFQNTGTPQIIHFNSILDHLSRIFRCKSSIWGSLF